MKNQVHYWLKPSMRFLGEIMGHYFTPMAAKKDKEGWENKRIQESRKIYTIWEETTISDGKTNTKCGRPWLRQVFDAICCCGEVEGIYTDIRIEKAIELAKSHKFL